MIIRTVTATNDFTFGNGIQNYSTGQQAIMQNIKTKLLEWVGNFYANLPAGIDWRNRLDYGQQANLIVDIKSLILNCYGVVSILSFSANLNAGTRFDSITAVINTIYGPAPFTLPVPQVGVLG